MKRLRYHVCLPGDVVASFVSGSETALTTPCQSEQATNTEASNSDSIFAVLNINSLQLEPQQQQQQGVRLHPGQFKGMKEILLYEK